MTDAMIVVDMQVGLLAGPPKHDLMGVIERVNRLAAMLRERAGSVVWIRHGDDEDFRRGAPGWEFLPALVHQTGDIVVEKTLNDPFAGTDLGDTLADIAAQRILVAGWATDLCVDATVRSLVSTDHNVVVVSDGHTLSDRPHLDAAGVIRHHNWVWANLLTRRAIRVEPASKILSGS